LGKIADQKISSYHGVALAMPGVNSFDRPQGWGDRLLSGMLLLRNKE
jgi:hypothetical protein